MDNYQCDRCRGKTYARIDVRRFDKESGTLKFVKSDYVRCVNCKGESYWPEREE